jgi:hypothetical protein
MCTCPQCTQPFLWPLMMTGAAAAARPAAHTTRKLLHMELLEATVKYEVELTSLTCSCSGGIGSVPATLLKMKAADTEVNFPELALNHCVRAIAQDPHLKAPSLASADSNLIGPLVGPYPQHPQHVLSKMVPSSET